MEIVMPEGHIIPPEGCIILPEGCHRPQVEAARRQDNAPRRWNNVTWGQNNFLWPEGKVVMITFLYRQHCFSLSRGCQTRDNDSTVFYCPGFGYSEQPKLLQIPFTKYCPPAYIRMNIRTVLPFPFFPLWREFVLQKGRKVFEEEEKGCAENFFRLLLWYIWQHWMYLRS